MKTLIDLDNKINIIYYTYIINLGFYIKKLILV